MVRIPLPAGLLLVLGVLLASCSDSTGPAEAPDDDSGLPATPDGVLLEGEPGSPAIDALVHLPPWPSPPDAIGADGFMRTRLEGVLAASATVNQVNAALESASARIVAMLPADRFVSLVVSPQADLAAARTRAAQLVASGAFAHANASWIAGPDLRPASGERDLPDSDESGIEHLLLMRMPAAWNAAGFALASPDPVEVIVADEFISNAVVPQLDALSFFPVESEDAYVADISKGRYVGNHGFSVAGIIGADFDGNSPTGTSPDPLQLLNLWALPLGGHNWTEFVQSIAAHLPAAGNFVLNTSVGYNDSLFTKHRPLERAYHAMHWRSLAAPERDHFFFAAAAGNNGWDAGEDGRALYNSPFCAARLWDDLSDMAIIDTLSPAESVALAATWEALIAQVPEATFRLDNGLVVGNADAQGVPHASSSRDWEVLARGENVTGPCVIVDPIYAQDGASCDGSEASYSGTSMASPQVAGLAAYLWNLFPNLIPREIREHIEYAAANSAFPDAMVDAYLTVLALDHDVAGAQIRQTILDVAQASADQGGPNGVFDEHDLEAFLTFFTTYEELRQQDIDNGSQPTPDYSRYDLNGDGWTGGDYAGRMDLSADSPPQFGIANQTVQGEPQVYDENAVSDLQALCYYAYSPLFEGDEVARAQILGGCGNGVIDGDVVASTQGEVDALAGVIAIAGTLTLGAAGVASDIFDLAALDQLTSIGGLMILNTQLVNLDQLAGITEAADPEYMSIVIGDNALLADISGLDNLPPVKTDLNVYRNAALLSLAGLDVPTFENCNVWGNPSLLTLGLGAVTAVENNLAVADNASLTELGLPALHSVGHKLDVYDNPALSTVGLDLANAPTDILIYDNDAMINLGLGLSGFQNLNISSCDNLTSLESLSSATTGGDLRLYELPALASLEGLGTLGSLAALTLHDLPALASLGPLQSIQISGFIRINECNALTTLAPLSLAGPLTGICYVDNCDALVDLTGLNNVSTCLNLSLAGNAGLMSLNGLGLSEVFNDLYIASNGCLDQGIVDAFLAGVQVGGTTTTSHNGTDCD